MTPPAILGLEVGDAGLEEVLEREDAFGEADVRLLSTLASSLAVIDSQQALFVAEREFVGATYDREVAVLQLQKSIGLLGKQT